MEGVKPRKDIVFNRNYATLFFCWTRRGRKRKFQIVIKSEYYFFLISRKCHYIGRMFLTAYHSVEIKILAPLANAMKINLYLRFLPLLNGQFTGKFAE